MEFLYDRSNNFTLCTYIDADWVGDCTSRNTTEVEYVTVENNYNQVIWMNQIMKDIGITFKEPVIIYCDHTSTVKMSKNIFLHSKTKHISIKYHVLREEVSEKEIKLEYTSTKEHITNIFTKALPKDTFESLRGVLGVIPLPTSKQKMKKCISSGYIELLLDQTKY